MKYTLEQIKNAYGLLIVNNNFMWLLVNNGKEFINNHAKWENTNQRISFQNYDTTSGYKEIFVIQIKSTLSQIYIYDHENFIRHFGMYFMKF